MLDSVPEPAVWAAIAVIGVLTFAIRASFFALFGSVDEIPPALARALRYVPPAVLAALVLPSLITLSATGGPAPDRLVAGGLAAAVAWRTESVLATIVVGMGALWTDRFLL
ncbi:MAG: AzlD domain-containing protein [Haloarculaceae archaeon]